MYGPRRLVVSSMARGAGITRAVAKAPDPFESAVKRAHRDRAARAYVSSGGDFDFLREHAASRIVDRISDVAKDFDTALDLGCGTGSILAELLREGIEDEDGFEAPGAIRKVIQLEPSTMMANVARERAQTLEASGRLEVETLVCPLENCLEAVPEGSVDIVVSSLSMHWANGLTEALQRAQRALKPDGVFIGAMLGGDTLHELRTSLAIAEQEREGGISAHVSPMIRHADACGLLTNAGFNLTTVDTETFTVEFGSAFKCMENLSGMGESNAVWNRRPYVSKDTFLAAATIYEHLYGDEEGYVPATFDMVYMIGWKPHDSQPKPLKPQVAQTSLGTLGKGFDLTQHSSPRGGSPSSQ
ncbi:Arginine-hydroxylase NDUFAF5, mitochondrial [Hondaea fermentalgiana]|uniref:Arginine-hydroxylase NDUFAF5, mitochondrial n=1 Tax=Hondaea fermentalgiana TaxID=2315210 RepID=A0A2R5GET2_9STRA|nr:Arginine-hydroxylase NDUFAF5, mitochondrial [Hondaea fermentalgiana]|eukprot:GBG26334.1 Arginine-hydroxylase NDUFAF5, mitochondrial [Hondaea fermentalgiana]